MELRLAVSQKDILFLYTTRTHPDVDPMLTGRAPSDLSEHLRYISKVQEKSKWIFVSIVDDAAVGYSQIYDVTKNKLEVGFVIHPDYQGRGLGKQIVKITIEKSKDLFPNRSITLYVKEDNIKAIYIYQSFGFKKVASNAGLIYMELE